MSDYNYFGDWQYWMFVVLPAVIAGMGILLGCRRYLLTRPYRIADRVTSILLALLCAIVALMSFSFVAAAPVEGWDFLVKGSPSKSYTAIVKNGVARNLGFNATLFRWQLQPVERLVAYQPYQTSQMKLAPVTDNPKVRSLVYKVQVAVDYESSDSLTRYLTRLHDKESIDVFVRRVLFDFDEQNSKALGGFYNPLKPDQQSQFYQLIEDGIGAKLAEAGLKVVSTSFDLVN